VEYPDAIIARLSEEHGVVLAAAGECRAWRSVSGSRSIPNHVCPTVNLQDEMFLVRDGEVAETWSIIARGKVR